MTTSSPIRLEHAISLHGLLVERIARSPRGIAYRYFETSRKQWDAYSWAEVGEQVARWQSALIRENLQAGDRVGVMLRNCPQWIFFDQAALSLGLVVVPFYTVDRPENVAYIVNDAQVKVLLFESLEQWNALSAVREQMSSIQTFVCLDDIPKQEETRLQRTASWLTVSAVLQPDAVTDTHQLATIIYTSGTTGKPKGVMLSHANILSNAAACLATFAVHQTDVLLSFLPLSHAFERTLGYYLTIMTGSTVAFARSVALLSEDLKIIQPTLLVSVPRIYERIFTALNAKLDESSFIAKYLFKLAIRIGWARFLFQQRRGRWRSSFLLWPILNALVARKLQERLGGRLRTAISGGAALSTEISRVFVGLGVPVVQGYGLTETSPVISANRLNHNYPGSVGQAIQGVDVKLGAQNALLIKGPNVMLGYWNNPEATSDLIDSDGWLNTGDIAHISESGHITITGRLKEIIVMSNGEKVPPSEIEQAILQDHLFDQVMVLGESRPYLVALAVVNPVVWQQLAKQLGVRDDMQEALQDTRVEQNALQRIAQQMREFPGYARLHRVLLLSEPWTIDNGLLTPTLKLKRHQVAAQFETEINQLYEGH
jgi:long-chain acyl-CoA synthetase